MRSLAEMVSVRPVSGALMDYPSVFVDPALGFAVGCVYWSVGEAVGGVMDANRFVSEQAGSMHEYGDYHILCGSSCRLALP
jgi:hypothetical protein